MDIHDGTFVSDTDIYGTLYHHLGPVDIANVSVRYSTFTALSLFGALFCEEESVDTSTLSGLELIGNSFDVVGFYGALSLDELDTDVNVENIEILGNSLVTDLTYGWLGYWTHTYGSGRWDNLLIAGNHQQAAVDPAPVIDEIAGTNSGSNWTIAYNTNSAPAGVGLIVLPDDWTLRNLDITSNDSDPGEALLSGFGTIDADYVNSFDSDANGVIDDGNGTSTPAHYAQSDPAYVYSEDDAVDWDLHPDVGSPLIDAGDPAILDADGSTSNLGAYGGPAGANW